MSKLGNKEDEVEPVGVGSDSESSADLIPKSKTSADLIPKSMTSADLIPKSKTSADLIPKSMTSADLIPKSKTSADLIPKLKTSADLIPKSKSSADLNPKSKSSADLIPKLKSPSILEIGTRKVTIAVTMSITRDVVKGFSLKYPTLANVPDVDPLDSKIMAHAVPASTFNIEHRAKVKPLVIKRINRQRSLNAHNHNTFYYPEMGANELSLVLRRGHPLRITLKLNRAILDSDVLFIEFKLNDVERPAFADGSFVRLKIERGNLTPPNNEFKWLAVCDLISDGGLTLHLQVRMADKTPLGHWGMRVLATSGTYDFVTPFRFQIYIIANPWGKDFGGFGEDVDTKRKEYVMADVGLTYAGYAESPVAVPWRFGQFEKKILEIAVSLLKSLPALYRSHLFKIVQHLSWMLHSAKGVIVETKNPTKQWAASPEILLQYTKKKKPVEGSSCNYVAPCVFVTVCRALGIPARPVTFYNVLPENDGGLGVDRYYHSLGLLLHNLNLTNMWSYKVMPEVLVQRPDLPRQFQPASWQCVSHFGPCSVGSIRAGGLYRSKPYGTDFVYRMVKAQYVNLKAQDAATPIKVVPSRTMMMCNLIVTKAVGSWTAENVISSYSEIRHAHRELPGPPQMRDFPSAVDAMRYEVAVPEKYTGGAKKCHTARSRLQSPESTMFDKVVKITPTGVPIIDMLKENGSVSGFYFDEEVDIITELITSSNWWGEPVTVALLAKSKLKSDTTSFFSLEISKVSETGRLLRTLKIDQKRIRLKPNLEEVLTIQILFKEYRKLLQPGDKLRVNANIHIEEEDYDQYFEKYIGFLPLNVTIKITNPASNNCEVSFANLSSGVMKKCGLSIRELGSKSVTTVFKGLRIKPAWGIHANVGFTPKHPTGIYFIEARASCGDHSTSAYAALSFNLRPTLIPNIPSTAFAPITQPAN